MKFQVGDEITFMHWGNLGRLFGVISEIRTNSHIVVTVDGPSIYGRFRMGEKDVCCLKALFVSPLMKELS